MQTYSAKKNLPKEKIIFRLARVFPFLIGFSFFKRFFLSYIPNINNVGIAPGFSCICGNITAKNVYLGDTKILDYAEVVIGDGVVFSGENVIITSTHDYIDFDLVHVNSVFIGDNVWVTRRCIILPGVKIGNNSIIGAGSVVTRDIPANVFAAGNPCKVIKQINRRIQKD